MILYLVSVKMIEWHTSQNFCMLMIQFLNNSVRLISRLVEPVPGSGFIRTA